MSNPNAILPAILFLMFASLAAIDAQEPQFKPIFDGQTLRGWEGDESVWRVEEGAIVGESTTEKPLDHNEFLIFESPVDDFELKLKFRITGDQTANSGIQIRSAIVDGHMSGYQADIDVIGKYLGAIYDENSPRKMLAGPGQSIAIDRDGVRHNKPDAATESADLLKVGAFNEYTVTCAGHDITVSVNGMVTSRLKDYEVNAFDRSGLLALQVHGGTPVKIEFKDIQLMRLPLDPGQKKVVFLAGGPSHKSGTHEHNAGCILFEKCLTELSEAGAPSPVVTARYWKDWPTDPTAFDNADTVVIYCDGGRKHFIHEDGELLESMMQKGTGLICIHYGVEIPKGPSASRLLQWIGGYFETDWSVNPHWTANFESLPDHPVANGVKPFTLKDEWYYHMRFVPEMSRVQPILVAMPPAESLEREDGSHSGNPEVRKAVLEEKQPQVLAWAFTRGDGKGRGFGFTGGHFHAGWQNDNMRKLILNAILWTAHADVPKDGVESATPTDKEMQQHIDDAPRRKKKTP